MALTYEALTISCSIAFAVSVFFTFLRALQFFSQCRRREKTRIADIVGLICLFCSTACITVMFGLDRYMSTNSIKYLKMGMRFPFDGTTVTWGRLPENNVKNITIVLLSSPSLWFLKGSYLCVFWTMSSLISKRLRIAMIALSVFMVITYGVTLGSQLLWCRPLHMLWTVNATNTTCATPGLWSVTPFTILFSMTASTDVALLIFAVCLVRSIEPQKRVGLIALILLFTIAAMSLVSSLVRFIVTMHYTNDIRNPKVFNHVSWHLAFWQYLEIIFAVVAYGLTTARSHVRLLSSGVNKVSKITSRISWSSSNSRSHLGRGGERGSEHSEDSYNYKGRIEVTEEFDVEKTLPADPHYHGFKERPIQENW